MKVYATMEKLLGGMMVILLLLGCVISTFIPQVLEIGGFAAGFFKNGVLALIGLFILCSGTTISFKQTGMPLYKGAVLTALKYIIGALVGQGLNRMFGPAGVPGLTPLAVATVVTSSNGAVYTALAKEFGDSTDVEATTILSLNDGPFLTMIVLGATGLAEIPLISIIAAIILLFIGMFLGSADEKFKMLLTNGLAMLLSSDGSVLGVDISLMSIVKVGAGSIILGLATVVCTGILTYYIYSAIRRKPDPMGMVIGTTSGNAVAVPASVAIADPPLNPVMEVATAQIAASVVVNAVLTPLLTGCFYKKAQKEQTETSDK